MTAEQDAEMMGRAIALARAQMGRTWPNPAVGCVLVKDGRVIAEAATAAGGRPHAEEQALALAGAAAEGAIAYVTMEPCGERSSGAACCAGRLAAGRVARVVFAADNPDARSAGRGPQILGRSGVSVEAGLLAEAAEPLYRAFRHRLATGLPLVEAAETGEGFDARFSPRPGESPRDAMRRYAERGYARLWTPIGGEQAAQLLALGLLDG